MKKIEGAETMREFRFALKRQNFLSIPKYELFG